MEATTVESGVLPNETTNGTSHGPIALGTVADDDWLFITSTIAGGSTTMTATGAGFSSSAPTQPNTRSGFGLHVWVRKLTAANSGASITLNTSSSLKATVGWKVVRGLDPDQTPVITITNGTSAGTMNGPSFSPADGKVLIHCVGMATAAGAPPATWTPPSGMTLDVISSMGGTTGRAGGAIASQFNQNTGISGGWTADVNNTWGVTAIEMLVSDEEPVEVVERTAGKARYFPWRSQTDADTLATAPTTTVTLGISSTIGGTLVAPNDARFRYRGAAGFAYGTSYPDTLCYHPSSRYPGGWGNPGTWAVEFMHTGSQFEMLFKYLSATGSSWVRISVDGRRTSETPTRMAGTTGGSMHTLKVNFGSSATRRILLEFQGVPFGGIYLASGDSLASVPAYERRIIVQGDSTSGGSDGNSGQGAGTWVARFGRYAGDNVDIWNQAIGGTGFVTPGTAVTIPDRLSDVTSYAPDDVILWCGGNDGSTSIVAEATAWINAVKSAVPNVRITVVGTWSPTVSASAARTARSADLQSAAIATGCAFISPITGQVYDQTGTLVATQTPWISSSGDVATYVYSGDNVHPTDAGHAYIARRMMQAMEALGTDTPALTITASAARTVRLSRTAAPTLSVTGTAAATVRLARTATASLSMSASATRKVATQAAGSLSLSLTATRTVRISRSASATLTLSAHADPAGPTLERTASLTLTVDASAIGVGREVRTANAELVISAAAELGTVALERTANLTLTLGGAGAWVVRPRRTAAATLNLTATAARVIRLARTANATLTLSANAQRGSNHEERAAALAATVTLTSTSQIREIRHADGQLTLSITSESQTLITAAAYLGDIPVVIALGDSEVVLQ